jgi:predicted transcriptional regulator
MDEGYIYSNKFRKAIFDEVASGETNIKRIAKKHHIILTVAKKVAEELVNNNYLDKEGEGYNLSKEGEKLAEQIR